jgi:Ni,Fe-hydrogenase I large subunit
MGVGPLARVLGGYAAGRPDFKEVVNESLGRLKLPSTALFSTLGRTAARALETRLAARWLQAEYDCLVANLKSGDVATANARSWDLYVAISGSGGAPSQVDRGFCGWCLPDWDGTEGSGYRDVFNHH